MDQARVNRPGAEMIWIGYQIGRIGELRVSSTRLGNQFANWNIIGAASLEAPDSLKCGLLFGAESVCPFAGLKGPVMRVAEFVASGVSCNQPKVLFELIPDAASRRSYAFRDCES